MSKDSQPPGSVHLFAIFYVSYELTCVEDERKTRSGQIQYSEIPFIQVRRGQCLVGTYLERGMEQPREFQVAFA